MPEIIPRGAGAQLTHTQLDDNYAETQVSLTSNTDLDSTGHTYNREHIICNASCTAITLPTVATLSGDLSSTQGGETVGWSVKISNNSGATVTISPQTGELFNGVANKKYYLYDNHSTIIGFDDVSGTKGFFTLASGGDNIATGTATLTVSTGTTDSTTISHGLGTDDIDFGFKFKSDVGDNTGYQVTVVMIDTNDFSVHDGYGQIGDYQSAYEAAYAETRGAGVLGVACDTGLLPNTTVVTVHWWARIR